MEIIVISVLSIILVMLLLYLPSKKKNRHTVILSKNKKSHENIRLCPLCQSPLQMNEKVTSHVFESKSDTIMHILGCIHCNNEEGKDRICPVCKQKLRKSDYIIARMFKKSVKTHVHVLGCTKCRIKKIKLKRESFSSFLL